jgi:hypothetical protein
MNIFKHIYISNEISENISICVNFHTIIYRHLYIYNYIENENFKKNSHHA